ncbi:ovochymase-1 isoform X1 [Dermochelys coriacea]|uniref:ovochymase-1 isoform X1 n=1 Tax=Dermochelys coriacea TaxID=27794 RepID=UPI0018E7868E|nr:ovochymase-1 isoform X1 [Dermochelys coriacea]
MGASVQFLLFVFLFTQCAHSGAGTDQLSGAEELLLSHQGRSQNAEDLSVSEPSSLGIRDPGLKCGVRPIDLENQKSFLLLGFFSRIVGGRNSVAGGQPWQVSLKLGRFHFCGGSLIQEDVVVTAAHCVFTLEQKLVKNLIVTVGEHNLRKADEQEQNIPVSQVIVHPDFNRFGYMHSDIALLYLKYRVKYGHRVQPICLPHKDDKFEAGTLCVASGWGRVSEAGELSNVLQEVELPIIDRGTCSALLKQMNLPPVASSMLCAGFPDGGKDACKGDSGGPLVCRRASGIWTLAGVTSWGVGCARGWDVLEKSIKERGSPGIFSNVAELMDFITQNVIPAAEPDRLPPHFPEGCSSHGMLVFGESGRIQYPQPSESNYLDNSLCMWNIIVPEDKIILIQFTRLDIESQITCDHDYVSFYSDKRELIGKICGDVLPAPLLIDSHRAMVTLVSDGSNTGSGFEFTFTAIHKESEAGSGCGSVAVLVEEGKIDTANYPGLYSSNVKCHWFIEAPVENVIKLEFEDFAVEFSAGCIYDAVVIYSDTEDEHQLANLCGFSTPSPILSPGNEMLIHFESDGENNFRGFKARFTFVPSGEEAESVVAEPIVLQTATPKNIPLDVCGFPPFSPQWLSGRVVGGEEACPHCWPWQAGLQFLGDHQCGGVVISPTWVLTAAHCIQSTNRPLHWTVIVGDHDRTLKESTEQVKRVKTIVVHPDFDTVSYDSDIALIQLGVPLELNTVVRPVCLPNSTQPLSSSVLCTMTGWGSTREADGSLASRLQQTQVPILESEVCERNYYFNHPGGITARMLCAGFASSGGQDSCQGDSGGPLVCHHEKEPFILYGIISWGVGCARPKKPGVYTRVRVFLDWIKSTIREIEPNALHKSKNGHETLTQTPMKQPTKLTGAAYRQECPLEVELTEPRGFFSSPCSSGYMGSLNCSWVLRMSPRGMAKLTVKHLSIPASRNCQVELLGIYEESQRGRKVVAELCGVLQSPTTFLSRGPVVKVVFHSLTLAAFGIEYMVFRVQGPKIGKAVKRPKDVDQELLRCRDVLLTDLEGLIQSPGYPHGYPNTTSCHWRIVAPLKSIIRLDFLAFWTEKTLSDCHGQLMVYEGFGPSKELIGNFCGEISLYPLKSDGPVVMLTFTSSAEVATEGFVLTYSFHDLQPGSALGKLKAAEKGCPILDLIPVGSAEITSPNYPNTYPNMLNCTWTVYSTSGNRLKAVIRDLVTENARDCIWDALNIYDGPNNSSGLLASLCGQKKSLSLLSSSSYLTLHFKTDRSVGNRGFKILFEEVNRWPAQKSRSGIELESKCPPTKLTASEENKCGIPVVDPFPVDKSEMNVKAVGEEPGKPRVVGGRPAPQMSWPWLVSLQYKNEHFCGGSLIAQKWVLTAGHCNFSAQTDRIVLGKTYLLPNIKGNNPVLVKAVHTHYNFSGFPSSNDLTLLELEKPIKLGDSIAIICLPDRDEEISIDARCLTAGWGATESGKDEYSIRLQQTNIPLLSNEACVSYWGQDIKNTNICGGAAGATACSGDSGGPLICMKNGYYKLIGIVSWGSDDCHPESPTVYTRISTYRDWISSVTNGKV